MPNLKDIKEISADMYALDGPSADRKVQENLKVA